MAERSISRGAGALQPAGRAGAGLCRGLEQARHAVLSDGQLRGFRARYPADPRTGAAPFRRAVGSRPDLRRASTSLRRRLRSFEAAVAINPHLDDDQGSGSRSSAGSWAADRPEACPRGRRRARVLSATGASSRAPLARSAPARGRADGGGLADRRARRRPVADRGRRRLDARRRWRGWMRPRQRCSRPWPTTLVARSRRQRARDARHRGRLAAVSARARPGASRLAGRAGRRCASVTRRFWPRSAGSSRRRRRRPPSSIRSFGCSPASGRSTLLAGDEAAAAPVVLRPDDHRRSRESWSPGTPAPHLADPPPGADLHRRAADRRPDRVPDRRRDGLPGRRSAAALRCRDLHGQPARHLDPARDRHSPDRDRGRGPLGQRLHRRRSAR